MPAAFCHSKSESDKFKYQHFVYGTSLVLCARRLVGGCMAPHSAIERREGLETDLPMVPILCTRTAHVA
jgi:hypothetical protein